MDKVIELAREAGLMFRVLPADYCLAVDLPAGHISSISDVTIHQIEKFYTLARADLEAENAKLYEALNDLYITAPESLECHHFHHSKNQRHRFGEECGPAQEYLKALKAARAALEKPND